MDVINFKGWTGKNIVNKLGSGVLVLSPDEQRVARLLNDSQMVIEKATALALIESAKLFHTPKSDECIIIQSSHTVTYNHTKPWKRASGESLVAAVTTDGIYWWLIVGTAFELGSATVGVSHPEKGSSMLREV